MSRDALRAAVLAARPGKGEIVTGPNGERVEIRPFSARERARVLALGQGREKDREFLMTVVQPQLVIACAHDPETGEKLFGPEDADALLELDPQFLDDMQKVATRVCGLQKGAVEEAGKDSAPMASGASSSASLSPSAAQ